ncbi:MAG: family 10 glycosylhydrolase [bacterium]|nr:family 10 glycosylhydrolase [bacterium]
MKNLFKKLLILLLSFICCTLSGAAFANDEINEPIIFKQSSYHISAIDPSIATNAQGSFFPGLRGSNQLIVYTPCFGLRTNTNEFGSEAIVQGNTVVSLSGADSIIPPDGIVISGHGRAKKWINENLVVGAKVYVNRDTKTLSVYIVPDSFIFGAKERIKETQDIINYYKKNMFDYEFKMPCSYINKAQYYIKKAERSSKEVQKHSASAIEYANQALAYSIPYKKNELKGVWIRPSQKNPEQVAIALDKINSAGIKEVFLETYFHGKTIFPSATMEYYAFTPQNEIFAGWDPLKVWIEEAHKRDMKIHIWFETFYVGNKNPAYYPNSILAVRPEWANVTKKNFDSLTPVPSISEHNGYFIDPANPDAQLFLENLLKEIITKYKPDGINLDYIRYPQSIAKKFSTYDLSNWGYTEYAREEFKERYGIDPLEILPNDPMWIIWAKYRQDQITAFVSRIRKLTRKHNIKLTAVIFPDRNKALETKQQDWSTWSNLNYVDGFTPLLLTNDAKTAVVMLKDVIKNKQESTELYAGLFAPFMGATNQDLLKQIYEARKIGAKGIIMFDYAHLNEGYRDTLSTRVFNENYTQMLEEKSKNKKLLKPKNKDDKNKKSSNPKRGKNGK